MVIFVCFSFFFCCGCCCCCCNGLNLHTKQKEALSGMNGKIRLLWSTIAGKLCTQRSLSRLLWGALAKVLISRHDVMNDAKWSVRFASQSVLYAESVNVRRARFTFSQRLFVCLCRNKGKQEGDRSRSSNNNNIIQRTCEYTCDGRNGHKSRILYVHITRGNHTHTQVHSGKCRMLIAAC